MNSLLQTLFILGAFRNVVYQMPSDNEIVNCLQRIFYNLETTKEPVRTAELLMSFGWGSEQRNVQQDVGEFWMMLSDLLEEQMKGTEVEGELARLFEGEIESVI